MDCWLGMSVCLFFYKFFMNENRHCSEYEYFSLSRSAEWMKMNYVRSDLSELRTSHICYGSKCAHFCTLQSVSTYNIYCEKEMDWIPWESIFIQILNATEMSNKFWVSKFDHRNQKAHSNIDFRYVIWKWVLIFLLFKFWAQVITIFKRKKCNNV